MAKKKRLVTCRILLSMLTTDSSRHRLALKEDCYLSGQDRMQYLRND